MQLHRSRKEPSQGLIALPRWDDCPLDQTFTHHRLRGSEQCTLPSFPHRRSIRRPWPTQNFLLPRISSPSLGSGVPCSEVEGEKYQSGFSIYALGYDLPSICHPLSKARSSTGKICSFVSLSFMLTLANGEMWHAIQKAKERWRNPGTCKSLFETISSK